MPQENWCFHFARGSNGRSDVGRRVSSHRPIDPSSPSGAASSAAEAAGGDLKAARQEVRSCRAYLKGPRGALANSPRGGRSTHSCTIYNLDLFIQWATTLARRRGWRRRDRPPDRPHGPQRRQLHLQAPLPCVRRRRQYHRSRRALSSWHWFNGLRSSPLRCQRMTYVLLHDASAIWSPQHVHRAPPSLQNRHSCRSSCLTRLWAVC